MEVMQHVHDAFLSAIDFIFLSARSTRSWIDLLCLPLFFARSSS